MDLVLSLLAGAFFSTGIYLLLSRALVRMLLGLAIFGNGIHLSILVAGRLTREVPPIVPAGLLAPEVAVANPLPQALILTAIVIGFASFTFLLVLALRSYEAMRAEGTDDMRLAEPDRPPQPPLGY
jgi:multicomponent Na+:H+ antiporter subunit C